MDIVINGRKIDSADLKVIAKQRLRPTDCSFDVDISLLRLPIERREFFVVCDAPIACTSYADFSLTAAENSRLRQLCTIEGDEVGELWPHDHHYTTINGATHHASSDLLVRATLQKLETEFLVRPPPTNHSKLLLRKFSAEHTIGFHIDRFRGSESGFDRVRRPICRFFVNLGDVERHVCFVLMSPNLVDQFVADKYSPNYLDPLYEALNRKINAILVEIPPSGGGLSALSLLTTHVLHCEYGLKGEFSALINDDGGFLA